ncbi:MAG: hypothetical protein BGO49_16595 [Planctomycetales bacterium 71-10]|nr:MAG: hypothetical protein BGO49_16595 [Planctomycetales bacterium 71-10]
MDAFEAAHDFRLPPSYRAFLKVFGPRKLNGMFFIAVPGGPKHFNLEDLASFPGRSGGSGPGSGWTARAESTISRWRTIR